MGDQPLSNSSVENFSSGKHAPFFVIAPIVVLVME